jgi:hypothetical protein
VIRPLQVLRDFGAEEAARDRMLGIARDADRAAVLDRDEHGAGVGTIVRTDRADRRRSSGLRLVEGVSLLTVLLRPTVA